MQTVSGAAGSLLQVSSENTTARSKVGSSPTANLKPKPLVHLQNGPAWTDSDFRSTYTQIPASLLSDKKPIRFFTRVYRCASLWLNAYNVYSWPASFSIPSRQGTMLTTNSLYPRSIASAADSTDNSACSRSSYNTNNACLLACKTKSSYAV